MLVDLNCDMGESYGAWTMGCDEEMLEVVTSANIACGFHAGDPDVMVKTLELAQKNKVNVGAHPGFHDIEGFGRRPIMGISHQQLENLIIYQVGALKALAESRGMALQHVKTHGSLGNMANEDDDMALAVGRAIKKVDPDLIWVIMPGQATERAAMKLDMPMVREIYVDRAYTETGALVSRRLPGAVLHDSTEASERIVKMLEDEALITLDGKRIPVQIDTVCVHGDTPGAVEMARKVRTLLEQKGVEFAPMSTVLASR